MTILPQINRPLEAKTTRDSYRRTLWYWRSPGAKLAAEGVMSW
ncbi:MAG: hypothetical protein R3E31_06845 [Chloroflexota bacterium]